MKVRLRRWEWNFDVLTDYFNKAKKAESDRRKEGKGNLIGQATDYEIRLKSEEEMK